MGTRSLTVVKDEHEEIVVMYQQYDGYPSGHGADLKEFLKDFTIVNGFGMNDPRPLANGASCLAAQIVAHFKVDVGGIYLHPAGTRDCGEEWTYIITATAGQPLHLLVLDGYSEKTEYYSGDLKDFNTEEEDIE